MAGAHFAGRAGAGGDQDFFGCDFLLRIDQQQCVFILEHGTILQDGHTGFFDIGRVQALQPVDFLVLVGDKCGPVEFRLSHGPAITRRIQEIFGKMAGIDQQLLGNAAANDAGAAHAPFFR